MITSHAVRASSAGLGRAIDFYSEAFQRDIGAKGDRLGMQREMHGPVITESSCPREETTRLKSATLLQQYFRLILKLSGHANQCGDIND